MALPRISLGKSDNANMLIGMKMKPIDTERTNCGRVRSQKPA